MAEPETTAGTVQPDKQESGGFPPFKIDTFPSQLFWLAVTFAFLFVVLWRFAGPRIQGVLADRRGRIEADIKSAEQFRRSAETAAAAYQAPLIEARERARAVAEQTRAEANRDADKAKADADAVAAADTSKAQARLAELRENAQRNIADVAQGAVVDIVARLTGQSVSSDEAAAAVREAVRG
jgi:F-type H+-transporting ATPase subunit b